MLSRNYIEDGGRPTVGGIRVVPTNHTEPVPILNRGSCKSNCAVLSEQGKGTLEVSGRHKGDEPAYAGRQARVNPR